MENPVTHNKATRLILAAYGEWYKHRLRPGLSVGAYIAHALEAKGYLTPEALKRFDK